MLYVSDDLGYKTATMLPPADLRRLILPWHKRFAELAHARGKLVFLHSCGQMYDLMDEYIDDVKIDAKHSFEDVIMPVTEAKRRYGVRLTLLGGMDVDFLARADEASIRARTRDYLDLCMPGGGYFLGTGNWVTHYIPLDNYLAMLDEGRKWG
jgi:uroporphyrinogen decarboxylase